MNKQYILNLLATNDKAVGRAVAAINKFQTNAEQTCFSTMNDNGVGFTTADARMGTSMAQFFARNGYLSPLQLAYWRKPNAKGIPRIAKYAGQLLRIAEANKANKA